MKIETIMMNNAVEIAKSIANTIDVARLKKEFTQEVINNLERILNDFGDELSIDTLEKAITASSYTGALTDIIKGLFKSKGSDPKFNREYWNDILRLLALIRKYVIDSITFEFSEDQVTEYNHIIYIWSGMDESSEPHVRGLAEMIYNRIVLGESNNESI